MNFRDANIILEVIKTRNISKAAENLFLAQSTVSSRLHQIETELGCELFRRKKGQRFLELTTAGEEVLPICQQMQMAQERIELLKTNHYKELRLASNESFYYEVLQPFCVRFKKEHPAIHLSLTIKDSKDVYQLISGGFADIGFASYESQYSGLQISPVYTQQWCVISGKALPNRDGIVDVQVLDPLKEIFYSAGNLRGVYMWRQQHMKTGFAGSIQVNSFIESLEFLREFQCWELATKRWAQKMQSFGEYYIYELAEAPAERTMYQILQHDKSLRDFETVFLDELSKFVIF